MSHDAHEGSCPLVSEDHTATHPGRFNPGMPIPCFGNIVYIGCVSLALAGDFEPLWALMPLRAEACPCLPSGVFPCMCHDALWFPWLET